MTYQMVSEERVEITTKRPSPRSHSDGYHFQGLHMEIGMGDDWNILYEATDLDRYLMANRSLKKISLNSTLNWLMDIITRGLPNNYREANQCSTEAIDWDGHRQVDQERTELGLPMGPSNPPAVRVWTTNMGQFDSRPIQTPNPLNLGGPIPDPYLWTRGSLWDWLDLSVPITGSAFRVSHLWSHSDMLLLIVQYWHWYVTVYFRRIAHP